MTDQLPTPAQLEAFTAQLGPRSRELRAHIDGLIATMRAVEADGLPVPPVIVPTVNQLGIVFAIVAGAESARRQGATAFFPKATS